MSFTWREIKKALDAMSDEQLDRPAQVWVHDSAPPEIYPLQPVVLIETVGLLASSEDEHGNRQEAMQTRSSYDNQHHPDDYVLLVDYNPFDERGNIYHTLTEQGWVGNADGQVDPHFLGGWKPGDEEE